MNITAYILMGKPGSGKGTQADLFRLYFAKHFPGEKFFSLETGLRFRILSQSGSYTAKIAKAVNDRGGLQPEFLAVSLWGQLLIENMTEGCSMLVDGSPRKICEAYLMDGALTFYNFSKVKIIYLETTHDEVTKRLLKRGRVDDTPSGINGRLGWFESDVAPVLEYFKKHPDPRYTFHVINGEQSIEKVHQDIIAALFNAATLSS